MRRWRKLSISLPGELAYLVRAAVKAGLYASLSEVVRDALRTWPSNAAETTSSRVAASSSAWFDRMLRWIPSRSVSVKPGMALTIARA